MLVKFKVILEQMCTLKFSVLINSYGLSASYFYEIKVGVKNLKIGFKSSNTVANYIFLSIRYIFHLSSKMFSKEWISSCLVTSLLFAFSARLPQLRAHLTYHAWSASWSPCQAP